MEILELPCSGRKKVEEKKKRGDGGRGGDLLWWAVTLRGWGRGSTRAC